MKRGEVATCRVEDAVFLSKYVRHGYDQWMLGKGSIWERYIPQGKWLGILRFRREIDEPEPRIGRRGWLEMLRYP